MVAGAEYDAVISIQSAEINHRQDYRYPQTADWNLLIRKLFTSTTLIYPVTSPAGSQVISRLFVPPAMLAGVPLITVQSYVEPACISTE